MSKNSKKPAQPGGKRTPEALVAFALLVALSCAGIVWVVLPRPVPPKYLPLLVLPRHAVQQVITKETALAKRLPVSSESENLQQLYREQNLAEAGELELVNVRVAAADRQRRIRTAVQEFVDKHGQKQLAAVRANAVAKLQPALQGQLKEKEALAVLGSFPAILERYRLGEKQELTAPFFVARTLYKARWNFIHQLPPTEGFAQAELQAYHGWLALHASEAPLQQRLASAQAFQRANGKRALEALGVLFYQAGNFEQAYEAFSTAYQRTRSIRLRNHALAAQQGGL